MKRYSKLFQILIAQLMLLLGAGLFQKDQLIPALIVLSVYGVTLCSVMWPESGRASRAASDPA